MYWRLLRRNRDFTLLYTGTLISLGGDWFLTVALLDLVLQLTGSATLASLMLLCQSLPIFIFTPIAGHVIDRVDRRKLMIAMDLMRTGACLLPLLARAFGLAPAPVPPARIIKKRRATFRATPAQLRRRPAAATPWRNLHLAGDYVDTGLPATIEGAIRSGFAAATRILACTARGRGSRPSDRR